MTYHLLQPDGSFRASEEPGTLGGNATLKIYGRLDCARAVASIPHGYARHRVFFADENAAIAAGFRPCARCLPEQYAVWKAGPSGTRPYPWTQRPHLQHMTADPREISEPEREVSTARVLAASPAEVFDAFRDPERLARWWGPEGFRSTFGDFDFREGGHWVFVLHAPDGTDYPNHNVFHEIVPDRRVVIDHVEGHWFRLTATLDPTPAGGTRIGWNQRFDSREERDQVARYVIPANEQNLDRLEAELERGR
ncbi:MAG TPA: SRPBCC domain-containing protein [Gemmatimonadaceae bacterium]